MTAELDQAVRAKAADLRELEVLEKVAERADLKVVLTEGGLADRLMQVV